MAEEKFREWNPRGALKVKYVDDKGISGIWVIDQQLLLQTIQTIVSSYQRKGIALSNRQLYYQLVTGAGGEVIPNSEQTYKRVCTFITDARYAGYLDWDAIEDRGRVPTKPSEWSSIKSIIRSATRSYRLPRWQDQEYYVELYCEKQAMESILLPIAEKYHMYFGANKGYSSASTMYDLATRVKEQIQNKKKVVILYLGDHDPSGLDMIRDVRDRITEFLTKGDDPIVDEDEEQYSEDNIEWVFEVIPLALNMEQVNKYNPPPNPAKITDPRAKWYLKKYGNKSWELDSLRPEVLTKITEDGIQNYIDMDLYNAWIKKEEHQKKALIEFGNTLSEDDGDEE